MASEWRRRVGSVDAENQQVLLVDASSGRRSRATFPVHADPARRTVSRTETGWARAQQMRALIGQSL
jgi:hypothetical protein